MAFSLVENNWMDKVAMNRQMTAAGVNEAAQGVIGGVTNAASSAWNEEYTGFQHLGAGAAGATTGLMNAALGVGFGLAAHHGFYSMGQDFMRSLRGQAPARYIKDVKHYQGMTSVRPEGGGRPALLNKGFGSDSAHLEQRVHAKGKSGVYRIGNATEKGRFIKGSRLMTGWGGFLSTAAFFAVPAAASALFGTAGKLLDEAHMAYQQAKYHQYDTRDFNNRQMYEWNMNKQNAAMSNLVPYENNMMSLSRVYHSR